MDSGGNIVNNCTLTENKMFTCSVLEKSQLRGTITILIECNFTLQRQLKTKLNNNHYARILKQLLLNNGMQSTYFTTMSQNTIVTNMLFQGRVQEFRREVCRPISSHI